jgi:Lysozyme like domain
MATLSREQVAQLAYQAGFRGEDLVKIVAIAGRESGYTTDAWRTDNPGGGTGDVGLLQINYVNVPYLRQAIGISSINDLLDPATNLRAAYALYQQGGLSPWTAGPGGWNAEGDPLYGTNLSAARQAVSSATSSGQITQSWSGSGTVGPMSDTSSGNLAVRLPSDTKIVFLAMDEIYAVYDVGGVEISYRVNQAAGAADWQSFPLSVQSREQWNQRSTVAAGSTDELLYTKDSYQTFKSFWDSTFLQVLGPNNPASADPEVIRVIAGFAARPDMDPVELQNRLTATQWFQQRNADQLAWNGLPEGEKARLREENALKIADTYFSLTGERVEVNDPRVTNYVEQISSGNMGWGQFNVLVRQLAAANPESPYSRQTRDEVETQRERGISIENTAQRVRDQLTQWGLRWTPSEVSRWAQGIIEKTYSDQDLLDQIKQQASILYPWKDPEVATNVAAMPWMEVMDRVMETKSSVFTPEVAEALTQGEAPWAFEQKLKRSDQWLSTRNGQDTITSLVGEVGKRMGFQ